MMDQLIAIKDKAEDDHYLCCVSGVFCDRDIVLCVDEAGIYASGFFFRCQSGKYIIRFPRQ